MNTLILHIKDIPEDVYAQLPIFVYNSWKKQFIELSSYANRIINYKFDKPINNGCSIHARSNTTYYISKLANDSLSVAYSIFFRFQYFKLKKLLNNFMVLNHLNFDFDVFYDKDEMLKYVGKQLSKIIKLKISVSTDIRYVTFTATVLLKTKSDVIIM